MQWLKAHWMAVAGLFLTALYIYLQLLQWKRHGDDLTLTAAKIVVTCGLWVFLLIAILKARQKQNPPSDPIVPHEPKLSKLVIFSANYAAIEGGGKMYDVTECLRMMTSSDSLILDIENHNFVVEGYPNFVPKDPKPERLKRLEVEYSWDNEPSLTIKRDEHSRLVLPEDSEIKRLKNEVESTKQETADQIKRLNTQHDADEYKSHQIKDEVLAELRTAKARLAEMVDEIERLKVAQGGPLTQRAFDAATKIRSLLSQHGARPSPSQVMGEDNGTYLRRVIQATRPWDDLIAVDWREIQREVLQVRSDLAKKGLQDEEFDGNLTAERPSEDQLMMFIAKLRLLGVMAYDLRG